MCQPAPKGPRTARQDKRLFDPESHRFPLELIMAKGFDKHAKIV